MKRVVIAGLLLMVSTTLHSAEKTKKTSHAKHTQVAYVKPKLTQEECAAQIGYAEARGESIEGFVAVVQATKTRAERQKRNICKVTGVKRKIIPDHLQHIYNNIAKAAMTSNYDVSKGADSWNTGSKPAFKGEIKRKIGAHVLYLAEAE